MARFMYLLAAATVVLAAGVASAAGSTYPDDRANHGVGAIARVNSSRIAHPDDRAWRGIGPAPTVEIVQPASVRINRFDWADAGIGAAAALGFGLLLAGATVLVLRRQRATAFS